MSTIATLNATMSVGAGNGLALGPATVRGRDGRRLRVERDGVLYEAGLAIPCLPGIGDVVLVAGQDDSAWVIGVIEGRHTVWEVAGDVVIRSAGSIDLSAASGVRVRGTDVALTGERVQLTAGTLTERYGSVYRWVKEAVQDRLGRLRQVIAGTHHLDAKRIVHRAEGEVEIDGDRINLG
jgi:hypothetical protein